MMSYSFGVFACGEIGRLAVELFREKKEQLKFVVLHRANMWNMNEKIQDALRDFKDTYVYYYENNKQLLKICGGIDVVILAFWGGYIKDELLNMPKFGYINLHTSYLPYGKGKHPHYWSLVDEKPYGVTVMKIDSGLDTGQIIFQKKIEISWSDTGKSLYYKAMYAMAELLDEKKDEILNLNFDLIEQNGTGTFHYGKELEENSRIFLEEKYTARNLLNILRARTFRPFPAAYFIEEGKKYEVTVKIKEVTEEFDNSKISYEDVMCDYQNYLKMKNSVNSE